MREDRLHSTLRSDGQYITPQGMHAFKPGARGNPADNLAFILRRLPWLRGPLPAVKYFQSASDFDVVRRLHTECEDFMQTEVAERRDRGTAAHIPMARVCTRATHGKGILEVVTGPLVRSSCRAEHVLEHNNVGLGT